MKMRNRVSRAMKRRRPSSRTDEKSLSSVLDADHPRAVRRRYCRRSPRGGSMEAVVRVTEQALKDAEMDKHDVDAVCRDLMRPD